MIFTPITKRAARTAAQLDRVIRQQLADAPQTLQLFDAFANLVDSMAGGLSGERLLVGYDELVADSLAEAQAALDELD